MRDVHHERPRPAQRVDAAEGDAASASLPDGPLLSVEQVAAHLNVSRRWVYERVQKDEIAVLRLGRHLRFRPAVVAAYVDACTQNVRSGSTAGS